MTNRKLAELYKVPLAHKTNKPTTAKGDLEDIYLKTVDAGVSDRVLELTLEIRSLDTTLCVSPDSKILTEDLRWVKASTVKCGDSLVGFDEELPDDWRRRLRYTKVLATQINVAPRTKLITERGELITSRSHTWLAEKYAHFGRNWYRADQLRVGATISYFCDPWDEDTSYEAGYLAGFLDGEGSLSLGRVLRFGQNEGSTLDHVVKVFENKGFKLGYVEARPGFFQYCIGGFGFQGIRALGSLRPKRLLPKADLDGCLINGRGFTKLKILGIELLPEGEVIAIKTDRRTFIADGCHSHNSNYVPNWKPRQDGRVHTTWGFKAPSGQLDSSAPNILNLSKWTETGQRFRRIIEAPKGYTLCELDKKSFHVATLGYCSQDASYIRFSQLDPHSIFASYICPKDWCKPIDLSLSDAEILERSSWLKKRCKQAKGNAPHGVDLRQDIAKRVVLANQLGQGKRGLYRKELRRYVEDEDEAGKYQDQLNDIFPKVRAFKDQIREICHKQKYYIIKEWGMIDYFFDVFNWRYSNKHGRWMKGSGTDSEKAIAFPVQGTAFGMLKWEHRRMDELGYMESFGFINSVHDSNVFCVSDDSLSSCLSSVGRIMSSPCGRLVNSATGSEGLRVAVEASVGKNLQDAEYFGKGTNPDGMKEVKLCLT